MLGFLTRAKRKTEPPVRRAFRPCLEWLETRDCPTMGPTITVVGEVRNPTLPWTSDMTLAKALIAAEYYGRKDPSQILIARNGQAIAYDPKKLLNGDDVPLQPRDVIEIRQ